MMRHPLTQSLCHLCINMSVMENFHKIQSIFCLCSEPNLLVRACNQLGQFLQHRETNLRYLALESMCTLASSEFSHEAVKTHIETVINALKVLYYAQQRLTHVCCQDKRWLYC